MGIQPTTSISGDNTLVRFTLTIPTSEIQDMLAALRNNWGQVPQEQEEESEEIEMRDRTNPIVF